MITDLLLLHQLRIRTIINDARSKNWRCQRTVYILRIQVLVFSVEYEVVPFDAQIYSGLLSKKNECEDIAILRIELARPGIRPQAHTFSRAAKKNL